MALFYEPAKLQEAGVRFVLVGGTADILHGVPRTTADLDLVLDLSASNAPRFLEVLSRPGRRLAEVDVLIDSLIAFAEVARRGNL